MDEKQTLSKIHEEKQTLSRAQDEKIVRIMSRDIEGKMKIYAGLTKVKGISWAMANAICKKLKIEKNRRIGSLSEEEIKKITDFVKNPTVPLFILNRQKDFETSENKHLISSDLELKKDFDIKRLKKIKSYRGIRHTSGLPSRGQRTKSHFRKNRKKAGGVKRKPATVKKPEQYNEKKT